MYVLKFNGDRTFVEKKSKIVMKGYLQIQEVDFKETYTVTACLESFWLLLAIIVSLGLHL